MDKQAMLAVNPNNIGGSRVSDVHSSHNQTIKLQTLDSLVDSSEDVKLIKIDVEGHEYQAILGSEKTIKSNRPIILFEQHISDFVDGKSKVINLLKSYGYTQFASIQKYPRASNHLNPIARKLYILFSRVIFGTSMRVILQDDFEPGLYSFIVAVPNWISIHSKEGVA